MNLRGTQRRRLLQAFMLAVLSPRGSAQESPPSAAPVQFRWAVRSPDAERLRGDLVKSSASLSPDLQEFKPSPSEREDYTDASFAPLMIVAGAVALSVLLDSALKWYRAYGKVGAVIDARGNALEIRELPSLPRGTILVLAKDRPAVMLEMSQGADVAALVKAVGPMAGK